jgi:hypothetical protein
MATEFIDVSTIITDAGTQIRVELDEATIEEYAEIYRTNMDKDMPDIVVFESDGVNGGRYLADGHFRLAAAKRAGKEKINATVKKGTVRDAILYACGANDSHGKRRTYDDRRNAVATLLDDTEWSGKADRWIADQCRVSNHLVGEMRKERTEMSGGSSPTQHEQDDEHSDDSKKNTGPGGRKKRGTGGGTRTRAGRDGRSQSATKTPTIYCERCTRVGKVKDCEKCKEARKKAAAEKRKASRNGTTNGHSEPEDNKESHQRNGKPLFDFKAVKAEYDKFVGMVDGLTISYPHEKNSLEHRTCLDHLSHFMTCWETWQTKILGVPALAGK